VQHAGGMLLPPVQKLVASSIFAQRAKMQTNLASSSKSRHPFAEGCRFLLLHY